MAHLIRLSICKESVRHQFSVGVLPAHYAGERDCRADTRVIDCHQPCGLHSRKDIVHLLPSKIPFLCETNFRELRLTWFQVERSAESAVISGRGTHLFQQSAEYRHVADCVAVVVGRCSRQPFHGFRCQPDVYRLKGIYVLLFHVPCFLIDSVLAKCQSLDFYKVRFMYDGFILRSPCPSVFQPILR